MSRIFAARVQCGVIVAEGLDLPEGAAVTVAANDTERECVLGDAELVELDDAIIDAEQHDSVSFEDVLADFDEILISASSR